MTPIVLNDVPEPPRPVESGNDSPVVLLVDDSRLQRRILKLLLTRWGYDVIEAASGPEALAICETTDVDIIISDWVMPEMSGDEFCRQFRALDRSQYVYFILLTSKSETDEIVIGLEVGADDFLTKPVNTSELRARLTAGERVLRMEQELHRKNALLETTLTELQGLYDSIERDLKQARTIQQSLVPQRAVQFGASDVSMLLKPCGHVGGDLVGAFAADERHIGFYNIDVSGHGITSAMMTARLAGYLSDKFREHNLALERRFDTFYTLVPPDEVATRMNDRLLADSGVEEYFTMAYGVVDFDTGRVRMVQAGHPHPALIKPDGTVTYVGEGGPPIGLLPGMEFTVVDVQLTPGDRLLFYSDGLTESVDASGTMLEEAGLTKLIQAHHDKAGTEFLDGIYADLMGMMASNKLDDDLSAIMLTYQ